MAHTTGEITGISARCGERMRGRRLNRAERCTRARGCSIDEAAELHHALAWAVLRLRPLGTWRPGSTLLRVLGSEITEELGQFMVALWMRADKDAEVRKDAKKAFASGWTLNGEEPGPADGVI